MLDINNMSKGNVPWPHTGATHYQPQLGLPDKNPAINGLVVCHVVWLGSMKDMRLRCTCLIPCFGQDGNRAPVLQHPIET